HYLPSNSVIQITDISGKILESNNVSDDNFEFTLKNAGIYTIQIVSNKGNWIYKASNN
ncbi:MAG: T9SS type A sorting domain-containing protein, partial [Paludibacter sp.]